MTDYVKVLLDEVEKGLHGKNIGVSTGLEKFDEVISGIQKATIFNIAAGLGVGKTSFTLFSFIYQPLKAHLENDDFKIIYFSLEMSAEILLAKLLSLHIYDVYNLEISYKKLMSRTKHSKLTESEYEIVKECTPWLYKVQEHLIIYDRSLTSDNLRDFLNRHAQQLGTFVESESDLTWRAKNPNSLVLVIIDHIGLLKRKPGQTIKDAIDSACNELIYFRNKCSFSSCILQQLNRTSESMDRRKAELQETELQDLKDSAGPSEAADVVISIFFPHRSKLSSYRGYKINNGFGDAFRSIIILKNRYGEVDYVIPLNFFGSIGLFKELDNPKQYELVSDYEPYIHLFPKPKLNDFIDLASSTSNDLDEGFMF